LGSNSFTCFLAGALGSSSNTAAANTNNSNLNYNNTTSAVAPSPPRLDVSDLDDNNDKRNNNDTTIKINKQDLISKDGGDYARESLRLARLSTLGGAKFERRLYLLVDNSDELRNETKRLLQSQGQIVVEATNGIDVLRVYDQSVAKCEPFDYILVDEELPYMNGRQVCKVLRSRGCTLPIIGMSAKFYGKDVIARFLSVGANAVVPKPLTLANLELAELHCLQKELSAVKEESMSHNSSITQLSADLVKKAGKTLTTAASAAAAAAAAAATATAGAGGGGAKGSSDVRAINNSSSSSSCSRGTITSNERSKDDLCADRTSASIDFQESIRLEHSN
jgi:CheY-like chemotaxis protein